MKKDQCVDLSKQMEADLSTKVGEKPLAPQIINGTGFKYLRAFSDILEIPDIHLKDLGPCLKDYLTSMEKIIPV